MILGIWLKKNARSLFRTCIKNLSRRFCFSSDYGGYGMDYDRNYLEITPISAIQTKGSFSFRKRTPVSVSLFAEWAESRSGHVDDEDYSNEEKKKVWICLTFFSTKDSCLEKHPSLPPQNYTEERVYRGELKDNSFINFILWEHQEEFYDAFTHHPMKLRRYGYKQLLKRYPWLEFAIFEETNSQRNA